jgi:predicted AlkP superfamily phosphohydrolase/phosphomutase
MSRPTLRTITGAVLVCVVSGCRASGPAAPAATGAEPHAATAARVVLLSVDGLAAVRHRRLVAEHAYRHDGGLAAFESSGYVVEHAVPVDPTLTAVSHVSIATGAAPGVTDVVNNRFHVLGSGITSSVSGFDAPVRAEALWGSFMRQGKRVGALGYPGCDNKAEARRADFGITYAGDPAAPAQAMSLDASSFSPAENVGGAPPSFSPPRVAHLAVKFSEGSQIGPTEFFLTAIDSTDDGAVNYDTLVADDDGNPANGTLGTAHVGEWFPLRLSVTFRDGEARLFGAWCLVQAIAPDLSTVRIYRGAFNTTEAYPSSFRDLLNTEVGFWPGPPDDRALERGLSGIEGGLTLAEYLAQLRRFSEYFSACARVAIAHERFDLLLAYQPIVDEAQHALTITDPRQRFYSPGMVETAGKAVDEAYLAADEAVADLARSLDLSRDALVVVSDHGIAPLWENVHLNEVLRRVGLAESDERRARPTVAASSQIVAVASGGCANLYVNEIVREPTGVVPADRVDEVARQAAQALATIEVDGEPVVEAMYTRPELAAHGLDGRDAGDLVVFLRPGYAATGQIGGALYERAPYVGQHGYLATHPEMHAVWLARGAGVPHRRVATASLLEVAAFVSRLAGVDAPRQARPWER